MIDSLLTYEWQHNRPIIGAIALLSIFFEQSFATPVSGKKRYWLHVAIDRFTSEVLDQQLEAVYE
jgi:hypothetical protein